MRPLVLVVEDGHEYTENLTRFLDGELSFERAGDGAAALARLAAGGVDALFLDMRFDRIPPEDLLGDVQALIGRFGDEDRAWRFLADNQGSYVLAALRDAVHGLPVVMSYVFDGEPRRFKNLEARYAPLSYLGDTASPDEIRDKLLAAARG